MSQRAKTGWLVVIVFLLGAATRSVFEPPTSGGIESCPPCTMSCAELIPCPDCVLIERPHLFPEIPSCPECPRPICAKATEYGCLHELRTP